MEEDNINKGPRRFLVAATSAMGTVGAAAASLPFIAAWLPSARAQAAGAPVKVDISRLEEGAQLTVEWRGRPVWIIHRPKAIVDGLTSLRDKLRDPDSKVEQQPNYAQNAYRSIKPQYLVLIGVCTHLACAPSYRPELGSIDSDWPGGFFCPCHGSKFDMAGRVYAGVPAPINLEVPPHHFVSDNVIVIGEGAAA